MTKRMLLAAGFMLMVGCSSPISPTSTVREGGSEPIPDFGQPYTTTIRFMVEGPNNRGGYGAIEGASLYFNGKQTTTDSGGYATISGAGITGLLVVSKEGYPIYKIDNYQASAKLINYVTLEGGVR